VYKGVVNTTLQAGTTTAVYFATLHLEPCKVLVNVALELGQRALVGKVCMDRNSPDDYIQTKDQNVEETIALIRYIRAKAKSEKDTSPNLPLVMPIVTPRFIPTCTPELMIALGKVASTYNCHIQSHISESIDEVEFSRHLDTTVDHGGGRTDAAIFDSHHLLSDRCIMAHGVHLSDDCLDLFKSRGSAVAHCPLSNFFFAGASLPCRKLMERGNKVGLGTDVAGGYSPTMSNSAQMAVIASRSLQDGDSILDYRHALYLATLGGAEALGLEHRIGTFKVGMEFDAVRLSAFAPILIFDTDTVEDFFQKLCTLGDDRHVKQVFVQGKCVVDKG
jgi:guanine deaminase